MSASHEKEPGKEKEWGKKAKEGSKQSRAEGKGARTDGGKWPALTLCQTLSVQMWIALTQLVGGGNGIWTPAARLQGWQCDNRCDCGIRDLGLSWPRAIDWLLASPHNSYVMAFKIRAFWGWLGHEGGASWMQLVPLKKRPRWAPSAHPIMRTNLGDRNYEPGRGPSPNTNSAMLWHEVSQPPEL